MKIVLLQCAFFALFVLACSSATAETFAKIQRGVSLSNARTILKQFGYDAGQNEELALVPRNQSHSLEFCALDDVMTLVIEYDQKSSAITSIDIVIIPERGPKTRRLQYSREVIEVSFASDNSFSLKFERAKATQGVGKEWLKK